MRPDFGKAGGFVPAIVQDARNGRVLMLGYMNQSAYEKTLETGLLHLWSRSRAKLWLKGEESGNLHRVVGLWLDCDLDAILVTAIPEGPTCHTGRATCFHNKVMSSGEGELQLEELEAVVRERLASKPEGSYTWELARRGRTAIGKKLIEEAGETLIAYLSESDERFLEESADLLYHLTVALAQRGLGWSDIKRTLMRRRR